MAEPETTVGTEVPHDAGHKKAFPPLDPANFSPQLIWLALTFVVLYALLKRIVLPRVGEVIEERRDRIKRDLDSAERLKGETERALAGYEKALADARGSASALARQARDKLTADVDAERTRVDSQIEAKVADAERRIAETKSKAMASVSEIAADTAGMIVSKLIGQEVSRDEVGKALTPGAGE